MWPFSKKKTSDEPPAPPPSWGQTGGAELIASLTFPTPLAQVRLVCTGSPAPDLEAVIKAALDTGRFLRIENAAEFRLEVDCQGGCEVRVRLVSPEGRVLEEESIRAEGQAGSVSLVTGLAVDCLHQLAPAERFQQLTGRSHPLEPAGLSSVLMACALNGQVGAMHQWARRLALRAHLSNNPDSWLRTSELLSYNGDMAGARAALERAEKAGFPAELAQLRGFGLSMLERCGRQVFAMVLLHGMVAHIEQLQQAQGQELSAEDKFNSMLTLSILDLIMQRAGMADRPLRYDERIEAHLGQEAGVLWTLPILCDMVGIGQLKADQVFGHLLKGMPLLYHVYDRAGILRQQMEPTALVQACQSLFQGQRLNPQGTDPPEENQRMAVLAEARLYLDHRRPEGALERIEAYLQAGPVRADALLMQAEGLAGLDRGQEATSALEQAAGIPLQPNEQFMLAGLAEKVMATWPEQTERCRALLTRSP
jgi:tetratricopeptide (TPR) repeat protein